MSRSQPPSSMLTRSADPSVAPSTAQPEPSSQAEELLSPESRPEDVFELLRELIETDQVGKARQLTREAVRRFPDHDRIRLAKRVLNDGKASSNPYVQPTATAEFEWLDDPPEEARGKWIALVGSELVAMADCLDELMAALKTRNLQRPLGGPEGGDQQQVPLVHHLPS